MYSILLFYMKVIEELVDIKCFVQIKDKDNISTKIFLNLDKTLFKKKNRHFTFDVNVVFLSVD